VTPQFESLPSDLATAHAMILAERTGRLEAEAKLANARAEAALIAYYKLEIEKLKRQLYGTRSERKTRLLERSFSLKSWRRRRPRMSWQPRRRRPGPRPYDRSSASDRLVGRSPIICPASAS